MRWCGCECERNNGFIFSPSNSFQLSQASPLSHLWVQGQAFFCADFSLHFSDLAEKLWESNTSESSSLSMNTWLQRLRNSASVVTPAPFSHLSARHPSHSLQTSVASHTLLSGDDLPASFSFTFDEKSAEREERMDESCAGPL